MVSLLLLLYSNSNCILFTRKVLYHKSQKIKDLLAKKNEGKEESQWQFTCILFAPNAPEQNPVEDVWLQAKNFLRRFWYLCRSFPVVKYLFRFFTDHQRFDFSKIEQYSPCSQII